MTDLPVARSSRKLLAVATGVALCLGLVYLNTGGSHSIAHALREQTDKLIVALEAEKARLEAKAAVKAAAEKTPLAAQDECRALPCYRLSPELIAEMKALEHLRRQDRGR